MRRVGITSRPFTLTPDDTLIELSTAGHEAAFAELFRRHQQGLMAYARHLLGDPDEAEDAVQHAFEAAHRTLRRKREIEAVVPWLYAVTRNHCLSQLRARRTSSPLAKGASSRAADDLAADVERREELRAVLADIGRLPEQIRSALLLTELGELSHAEVAVVLGVPTLRVKKLVFQARAHLAAGQQARSMTCLEVREELSTLTRGALRRGYLRAHLEQCEGCAAFREQVRRRRRALGLLLPAGPGGVWRWWRSLRRARPRGALSGVVAKPVVVLAVLAAGGGAALAAGVPGGSSHVNHRGLRPSGAGIRAGRQQGSGVRPANVTRAGAGGRFVRSGSNPTGPASTAGRVSTVARRESRVGTRSVAGRTRLAGANGSATGARGGTSAAPGNGVSSPISSTPSPPPSASTSPRTDSAGGRSQAPASPGSTPRPPAGTTPGHGSPTSAPTLTTGTRGSSTTPTSTSAGGSSPTSTSGTPASSTTTASPPTTTTTAAPTTTAGPPTTTTTSSTCTTPTPQTRGQAHSASPGC